MPRRSHNPLRTCMGCMRRDFKERMVRIASHRGMVRLDVSGGAAGRGGYLHPAPRCLEQFTGSRIKEFRSLKSRVDRETRSALAEEIRRRLDSGMKLE
jgi:predicted RNA-binding protein YlxR (DUF448 family)